MTIYDFTFDSLALPTNDDLYNTMCGLDSYKKLIYDKKCDLFESEINELTRLLNLLHTKLYDLNNLADELDLDDRFNIEISHLFSDDELSMINTMKNKVLIKRK